MTHVTNSYDPRSPTSESADEVDVEVPCLACGHQRRLHGTTATRFCRATLDRALARGCLCDPPEAPSAAPMYGRGRYSGR